MPVVPDGHQIGLQRMVPAAGVSRTHAGVIVASFGAAGDDAERELGLLLAGVERELAIAKLVELVTPTGPLAITDLFAPAEPPTVHVSVVGWMFHAAAAGQIAGTPALRVTLLERVHRLAAARTFQFASVLEPSSPASVAFVQLLHGLDVDVRTPDNTAGELTTEFEVSRSDGRTLACVAGPVAPVAPRFARGELVGRPFAEVAAIAASLDVKESFATFRSPRLYGLLGRPDAEAAIIAEVVGRPLLAFLIADPSAPERLRIRRFGEVAAVPVYPDMTSIQWAATDMAMAADDWQPRGIEVRRLLPALASRDLALAIGMYRDRQTPIYVIAPPEDVKRLVAELGL
jgi:hypothetical protein